MSSRTNTVNAVAQPCTILQRGQGETIMKAYLHVLYKIKTSAVFLIT
jgi:hypothetical protein